MRGHADLDVALAEELERWRAKGLGREVPALDGGAEVGVDFTSNDYLGLSSHPDVIARARMALERWGAGGKASRLLGGGSALDVEAEQAAAEWLDAEAALLFPSGYHANLGVIGALAGPGDLILSDRLNHASLVDAARLSRARVRVFRHSDVAHAQELLAAERGGGRALLVTESVFSMDGDRAPLGELAELCLAYDVQLVIDEAHAAGILGPGGAGAWVELKRADRPAARVVTAGKALGVAGAFVVGSARLREQLVNRARTFAFTTAAPPAVSGALAAAIPLCRTADAERERCRALARRIAGALGVERPAAAIVPVVVGRADDAMRAAEELRSGGFHVRAVRPPTVPEGSSRLRVVCHAFNTEDEVDRLIGGLRAATEHSRAAAVPAVPRLAHPLFVAGTDTGVGKTVVSALLARGAWRRGRSAYWKPVQTGADDDSLEVQRLTGTHAVEPGYRFALPASPHEAARDEDAELEPERLHEQLDHWLESVGDGVLVTELAGGLLVPLTDNYTQLDWLAARRPALVLVARSGLGTLNHTLLSLEALRVRNLEPRALFLVGAPHRSNYETLARMSRLRHVFEVPLFEPLDTAALDAWLDANDLAPVLT
jgi:8-amino-7-oxononanoate synthase